MPICSDSFGMTVGLRVLWGCGCLILGGCSTHPPSAARSQIALEVAGEVRRPGRYEFPKPVSLAEAIDRAGGFSEQAFLIRMRIVHCEGTLETRNFRTDGRSTILRDGDRVIVNKRAPF